MGYIASSPWTSKVVLHGEEREVEYRYMVAWGKLTRDPKIGQTRRGVKKFEWGIRVGDEEDNRFLNCILTGSPTNKADIDCAYGLHENDRILVAGRWSKKPYYSKKQNRWKHWTELTVQKLVTDRSGGTSVIFANPNGEPDAFEGELSKPVAGPSEIEQEIMSLEERDVDNIYDEDDEEERLPF